MIVRIYLQWMEVVILALVLIHGKFHLKDDFGYLSNQLVEGIQIGIEYKRL